MGVLHVRSLVDITKKEKGGIELRGHGIHVCLWYDESYVI